MALSAEQLELLNADISGAVDPEADLANDNLVRAAEGNPDQFAADRKLGLETGTTPEIAGRNRPQLEKFKYLDELDLKALNETPATQEWLKDTDNAKIAYDDVAVLQNFERESQRSWWEAGEKVFEGFGEASLAGLGKAWDGIALAFLNETKHGEGPGSLSMYDMDLGEGPEQQARKQKWKQEREAQLDLDIADRTERIAKAEKEIQRLTPQGMTTMEEGLRGAMQVGIDMGPGLLVSAATRGRVNPTLGFMGGKVFGDSYGSAIEGGKDHKTAMRYATIDTVIEIATERFPMKRLEAVVGDLGGKTGKSWLKKFMIEDIGGEQAAAIGQTMNAYMHDLDDELAAAKDFDEMMDIQARRQAVALIATMVGGGSIAGSIKGVDYLASREQRAMSSLMKNANKRRGAEFDQERLDKLIHLAQSSKTNERAADVFDDFVAKASPDQKIFIDAEAIEQLDDVPEALLAQLDGSGGTVEMSLNDFLKEFAMDEAKMEILRPFIKTNEKHANQTELEEDVDADYIKTLLAKANEATETKDAADEIYQRVTEQLVATGRLSAATARQSATLLPAQVTTQYEYYKARGQTNPDGSEITLEQLYGDLGLEIVGPQTEITSDTFMTQGVEAAEIVNEGSVTLEDGRTYEKQKVDDDYQLVMVDAALFEDLWTDSVGPGPEYANQISNRMEQYEAFRDTYDRGHYVTPQGKEIPMRGNIQVGNAFVRPPEGHYTGYLSMGDGRHRARAMIEQGLQKIPVSMDQDSINNLQKIIEARGLDVSPGPRVLRQQDFGNIAITETVLDEAGMPLDLTESANDMWREQQRRLENVKALRRCFNG